MGPLRRVFSKWLGPHVLKPHIMSSSDATSPRIEHQGMREGMHSARKVLTREKIVKYLHTTGETLEIPDD